MTDRRDPAIFSIPSHRGFADAFVAGLLAQYGDDQMALARGLILVPNNRAAIAIQDAFVRQSERGMLLPRLVPIGDADLGEHVGYALDPLDMEPIPPAIDPLQRQMIFARKLQQIMPVEQLGRLNAAQAMRLAAELGRVLDQLIIEKKSLSDLKKEDSAGQADHWDHSFKLLNLILADWPQELERLAGVDLAERRNLQIERICKRWQSSPPVGFVVAAGVSTAAPAIAAFLKTVTRLEQGQVVLAGLDLDMPEEQWEALAGDEKAPAIEAHPQFHLQLLLQRIDVPRALVRLWPWGEEDKGRKRRAKALAAAMAPAAFTMSWAGMTDAERKLPSLAALETATPAEEAQTIALALREAIETPEKTAALVTPDRNLARRVVAHMRRWGIEADDSAGQPLSMTLPGMLILALAQAMADHFAPVPLLALLKHPLVHGDGERLAWLDGARALDLALRGPKPLPHLDGISALLRRPKGHSDYDPKEARTWWDGVREWLAPLEQAQSFSEILAAIRDTAQILAGDEVWSGQDGRSLAELFSRLEELAPEGPADVALESVPFLLRDLMDGIAIRPAQGGHPRLFIWGLLEAKLQSADLMIMAGLNEGSWPQLPAPDPWLAPAIRRQLQLPSLERRIGLSAHDFVSAAGAKKVLLSRAKRDMRSPTVASRFWLRLETLTQVFSVPELRYDLLARALDHAEGKRASQPAPCPPTDERPRRISVTQVDGLKADPYSFYAKKMLKLVSLDAPGEEPNARWRGTFLHEVLHIWGKEQKFQAGTLLPLLREAFTTSGLHPVIQALWLPRFEQAAARFEERVEEQRAEGREPIATEIEGSATIFGVTLTGTADRIDKLSDGSLAIIDYKTGDPPSDLQVKEGFALQLGLLGFLAENNSFDGISGQPSAFEYWSQSRDGKKGFGKFKSPTSGKGNNKSDPDSFVGDMFHHFEQAIEAWLLGEAPFTAKLHPDLAWSDYDQLMRYDEWRGRSG